MNQMRNKVVSKSGSLTIPSDIRREFNSFLPGEAVDITMEDGKLILAPHAPRCIFCDNINGVGKFKGRNVCKECVTAMVEVIINNAEE